MHDADQARSAGIPLPGIDATVMTLDGRRCAPGDKGIMVLKRPFPGLTPALWGEPDRYDRDYWHRIPNVYYEEARQAWRQIRAELAPPAAGLP